MTTTQFLSAPDNTSDATFRAWVSAWITALTTVGLVQTTDTGQINVATVARPAAASVAGYAIFAMADSKQATHPLFIKLEFGTGARTDNAAASIPAVWLTIGKGTNGAGTLSPLLFGRTLLGNQANSSSSAGSSGALSCVASGGDGWVAMVPWLSFGTQFGCPLPWFILERSPDSESIAVTYGATTSNAPAASDTAGGYLPSFLVIGYASGQTNVGIVPVLLPHQVNGVALGPSASLASGSIGPVFPWLAMAPSLPPWQCVNALSYPAGDTPGAAFTSTLGGVTRTYLPIPLTGSHTGFGLAIRPGDALLARRYLGLAIRWE